MTLRNEYQTINNIVPHNSKKIVAVGGGTGMSTMLRGLKMHTQNITAVVTMADDGGGSGQLRNDLGILPPGDVRNCILGLAKTDPIMERLLNYRFSTGTLKGQSFGNLFLAAMCGISSNFEEAVKRVGDVLKVTGRVLPVTLEDVNLSALYTDGHIENGESNIPKYARNNNTYIEKISVIPKDAKALDDVITAINEADALVFGPGSLYTSIIPNLLIDGVSQAIKESDATKIFICNLVTQPGETTDMTAFDHVKAVYDHVGDIGFNYCIINNMNIPYQSIKPYLEDGANEIKVDEEYFIEKNIKIIYGNFAFLENKLLRHDYKNLAKAIMECIE